MTKNIISTSQFLNIEGGKTKSNAIEIPSISLPKGGGAIKGIDEKFHKSTYRFLLGNIFNLLYINFSATSLASD